MKVRGALGAVHRPIGKAGLRKRQAVEKLADLHRSVVRIRCLVEDGQDYLDIVGETNKVQARLRELALLVVSDRMQASLSSMFFPVRERDRLVSEVVHALSGFHRKRS